MLFDMLPTGCYSGDAVPMLVPLSMTRLIPGLSSLSAPTALKLFTSCHHFLTDWSWLPEVHKGSQPLAMWPSVTILEFRLISAKGCTFTSGTELYESVSQHALLCTSSTWTEFFSDPPFEKGVTHLHLALGPVSEFPSMSCYAPHPRGLSFKDQKLIGPQLIVLIGHVIN